MNIADLLPILKYQMQSLYMPIQVKRPSMTQFLGDQSAMRIQSQDVPPEVWGDVAHPDPGESINFSKMLQSPALNMLTGFLPNPISMAMQMQAAQNPRPGIDPTPEQPDTMRGLDSGLGSVFDKLIGAGGDVLNYQTKVPEKVVGGIRGLFDNTMGQDILPLIDMLAQPGQGARQGLSQVGDEIAQATGAYEPKNKMSMAPQLATDFVKMLPELMLFNKTGIPGLTTDAVDSLIPGSGLLATGAKNLGTGAMEGAAFGGLTGEDPYSTALNFGAFKAGMPVAKSYLDTLMRGASESAGKNLPAGIGGQLEELIGRAKQPLLEMAKKSKMDQLDIPEALAAAQGKQPDLPGMRNIPIAMGEKGPIPFGGEPSGVQALNAPGVSRRQATIPEVLAPEAIGKMIPNDGAKDFLSKIPGGEKQLEQLINDRTQGFTSIPLALKHGDLDMAVGEFRKLGESVRKMESIDPTMKQVMENKGVYQKIEELDQRIDEYMQLESNKLPSVPDMPEVDQVLKEGQASVEAIKGTRSVVRADDPMFREKTMTKETFMKALLKEAEKRDMLIKTPEWKKFKDKNPDTELENMPKGEEFGKPIYEVSDPSTYELNAGVGQELTKGIGSAMDTVKNQLGLFGRRNEFVKTEEFSKKLREGGYSLDQKMMQDKTEPGVALDWSKPIPENFVIDNIVGSKYGKEGNPYVEGHIAGKDLHIDYIDAGDTSGGAVEFINILKDKAKEQGISRITLSDAAMKITTDLKRQVGSEKDTRPNLYDQMGFTPTDEVGYRYLDLVPSTKANLEQGSLQLNAGINPSGANKILSDIFKGAGKGWDMIAEKNPAVAGRIDQLGQVVKEFLVPGSRLDKLGEGTRDQWLKERSRGFGGAPEGEYEAKGYIQEHSHLSPESRTKIYDFLTETQPDEKSRLFTDLRPDEANSAMRMQDVMRDLGNKLVQSGVLKEEELIDGGYIKRIYGAIVDKPLEAKPKTVGSPGDSLNESSFSERKISDEATLEKLKLIKDPVAAGAKAIVDTYDSSAMRNYFNWVAEKVSISPDPVEYRGKRLTVSELNTEINNLQNTKFPSHETEVMLKDLQKLRTISKKEFTSKVTKAKLPVAKDGMPADYKLIQGKKYGPLDGAYVPKAIADDILPITEMIHDPTKSEGFYNTLRKGGLLATSAWKAKSVALNIPTMFRNAFMSNPIQLNISGMRLDEVARTIPEAAKVHMNPEGEVFKELSKRALYKSNFSQAEMKEMLDIARSIETDKGGKLSRLVQFGIDTTKFYGKIDDFWKTVKALDVVKKGGSYDDAVLEANKWVMDYSLMDRNMKHIRSNVLGAPFASYQYKIAPLVAEALRDRPLTVAKWALSPVLLRKAIGSGMDDEEYAKWKKNLPQYIKKGQVLLMPGDGKMHAMDVSQVLPWGNLWQMIDQATSGDFVGAMKESGLFQGPGPQAGLALVHGEKPNFEGTAPIISPLDKGSAVDKAKAIGKNVHDFVVPPMLSTKGAIGPFYAGEGRIVDYLTTGMFNGKELEGKNVWPRIFGININTVDPHSNVKQAKKAEADLMKAFYGAMYGAKGDEQEQAAIKARARRAQEAIKREFGQ